jgi:hypothetical protein
MMAATATYYDSKYIISFPGKDRSVVYDRERLSWVGPWTFDTKVFHIYYDGSNDEYLLFGGDSDPYVYHMSEDYTTDNGTAITTTLKTRSEDFDDWSIFKVIKTILMNMRNVTGSFSIDIRTQGRDGQTTTAESFDVQVYSGNAGWGADMWGSALWGDTEEVGGAADINDLVRWMEINKTGRRFQIIIRTSNRGDNYELLGIKVNANPIGTGLKGADWWV